MANTEWWQRGPIDGVPALLQPVAHILLQVRESVGELVANLSETECTTGKRSVISLSCATHHGCDRSAFYVCPWRSIVAGTISEYSLGRRAPCNFGCRRNTGRIECPCGRGD